MCFGKLCNVMGTLHGLGVGKKYYPFLKVTSKKEGGWGSVLNKLFEVKVQILKRLLKSSAERNLIRQGHIPELGARQTFK